MKKNLKRLLSQGFSRYGTQGENIVYKKDMGTEIVLYNSMKDKIVGRYDLNELNEGLEEGDFSAIDFEL